MKKAFVLFIVLISFCFAGLNKSIEFTSNKVKIKNSFIGRDGNQYQTVSYGTEIKTHEEGKPELPVVYKQYIMSPDEAPDDITYHVVGKSIDYTLNAPLLPSQKDIFDPLYNENVFITPNEDIYNSDDLYPKNAVEVIKDSWLDGNHIVQLAFYPIQYSPCENKLIFHENIFFQLNTKSGSRRPDPVKKRSKYSQNVYNSALKMAVDNDEDIPLYQVKPNQYFSKTLADSADLKYYDYVIITKDSLISAFDDLVGWKMRKGINIGVVDVDSIISAYPNGDEFSGIDDEAGSVRQYLINSYENGTTYVLIGGDDNIVPVRYAKREYSTPTDLYYSDLSGDWSDGSNYDYAEAWIDDYDDYPEVFVGRVTGNNSEEIENWITKLLIYEQDPGRGDPSYLCNSFFSQADEMQNGNYADQMESFMDTIGFSYTMVEEAPSYNSLNPTAPTSQTIINELNTPYGLNSLIGHGSRIQISVRTKGVNNQGIPEGEEMWDQVTTYDNEPGGSMGSGFINLSNYNKPAIHFSISCANCSFDDSTYFNPNDGHQYEDDFSEVYLCKNLAGGIAYVGNTRDASGSEGLNLFKKFILLLREGLTHIGVSEDLAKAERGGDIAFVHNLFGCPEMMMWTDIPEEFVGVTITDSSSFITVNAGENDCMICVSANDPDDYWKAVDSAQTDTFQTSVRPLHVVITKMNKLPYINLYGLHNITGTITINNKYAYTITNDITVTSTGILNIEPGTTLRFAEDKELKVYGELNINGTEESPVVFTSDDLDAGEGYWDKVKAYSGGEINADNLYIYNANAAIVGEYAKITLDSCLIKDNSYGIMVSNCTGSNSCTVENSTIISNTSYSIRYYNSNGIISGNNISDAWRGIYAQGDVDINNNVLSDFQYDGIWGVSYDGDICFNDISDCRSGIYLSSFSSGDIQNWWNVNNPVSTAENNTFSTPMISCISIGSLSTPDLGTMFDLDEDIQAGWNVFCDPTDYDVKSLNSSTIMAEGNWWGSTRSILGNVDYTYQAEEIAAIFQKAVALSEEERLFKEAYELERSGDYQEAASSYLSLIEKSSNKDDITYVQKSMNRIRGCYRKLNAYSDLEKVLSNLSNKYPDTYVSAMAKNMNAPQLSLKKDFTHALNCLTSAKSGQFGVRN